MDLNQPPSCDQTLSGILRTLLQILADPLSDGVQNRLLKVREDCISDGHTGCFLSSAFLWDAFPQAKPLVLLFLQLSLWSTKETNPGGKIKPLTLNEPACGESHFQKHR